MCELPFTRLFDSGVPLVIAHRGASGDAPENTMAAFELAVDQGADVVELDVHLTSDGHPIVFHDDLLDRTTNAQGLVRGKTLAQIQELDAGGWFGRGYLGEHIPTLDEVVQWAAGKVALAIEVKNVPHRYSGIEASVAGVLERTGTILENEVFSFDHLSVQRFKFREPRLLTGVCYRGDVVDHKALAIAAHATVLHPGLFDIRSEAIRDIHAAGLVVFPWTVNTAQDIDVMALLGVDGITTNYPALARRIIGN